MDFVHGRKTAGVSIRFDKPSLTDFRFDIPVPAHASDKLPAARRPGALKRQNRFLVFNWKKDSAIIDKQAFVRAMLYTVYNILPFV